MAPPSEIEARIVDLSDLSTPLATCLLTSERGWGDVINDTGSFSITFQNDDPDLAQVVTPNRLITFSIGGVDCFTGVFIPAEATLYIQGEESAEITIHGGLGHLCLLDRHLIYPALALGSRPIEEDRGFSWHAAIYDWVGHGAVAATAMCTVLDAQTGSWPTNWDTDFADTGADVLGPSTGNTTTAPLGACYYQQTVTIATLGNYTVEALMDNYGEVDFDGALLMTPGQNDDSGLQGFLKTVKRSIELSPGLHSIAARCFNWGGPTGFAFTVVAQNADGTLGAVAGSSSVADGALVIEYPAEEPGMTAGEAILVAIGEAQSGTALGGGRATGDPLAAINLITPTFDAVNDSDGNPWPMTGLIATKIGTSILTFLRELAADGYIDFSMTPGTLNLNAWIGGQRGGVSGVDFHRPTDPDDESTGNLTEHHEKREA